MSRERYAGRKIGLKVIFCLSIIVGIFALYQLFEISRDNNSVKTEYKNLEKYVQSDGPTEDKEDLKSDDSSFAVDFEKLQSENPDCIAWIHFPDLSISYPVLQGEDNEYYLRHTFSGERSGAASIFMDAVNKSDFSDDNTFIYGHNMKDDSMFGLLDQYESEEFYRQNPGFYIYTPEKTMYFSIFSCYRADVVAQDDSFSISFDFKGDYMEYVKLVEERSLYDTGIEAQSGEKMVTLMTCNRAGHRYRFLVHAIGRAAPI